MFNDAQHHTKDDKYRIDGNLKPQAGSSCAEELHGGDRVVNPQRLTSFQGPRPRMICRVKRDAPFVPENRSQDKEEF